MPEVSPDAWIPAVFGLLGVIVGGLMAVAGEWLANRASRDRQFNYLAVRVVHALDRLVMSCAEVVADDGLSDGQTDENGCRQIQVPYPWFEPDQLDVEWKLLSPKLLHEILNFPYKIELAERRILNEFEYGDGPPDFINGFETRRLLFGRLGLEANNKATELRKQVNLPEREKETWDPIIFMEEKLLCIEAERNARYERASSKWDKVE